MSVASIEYRFTLAEGKTECFHVVVDSDRFEPAPGKGDLLPDWTRLDCCQCPHCPLDAAVHPRCPLAVSLVDMVERFAAVLSHHSVELEVRTPSRTIHQRTTAQEAISSLMGLISATSGCPHTRFFRPMAQFHLPMASRDETIFRALSTYLMRLFYLNRKGEKVGLEIDGLRKLYANVEIVNSSMAERLRRVSSHDANVNALVQLDNLAKSLTLILDSVLDRLEPLFLPPED